MTTFAILLGGNLTVSDRLKASLSGARFIAADGGMRHATALNVVPELWVGDFDSAAEGLQEAWPDVPREPYPMAKAVTDGEIAVEAAISRGATRLILVGALGGERSDHALMHYFQAIALADAGFQVALTSGHEEAWPLVAGTLSLDSPRGSLFSVMALTDLQGLTISNARYPLAGFDLPFGSSRTLSNVAEGPVKISVVAGKAMVIARPDDFTGV